MPEWQSIANLGEVGLETDQIGTTRALNSLDLALNVRREGSQLEVAGMYDVIVALPASGLFTTIYQGLQSADVTERSLYLTGQNSIQEYNGTAFTDLTGATHTIQGVNDLRWSGGWLGGGLTFCGSIIGNSVVGDVGPVRTYKPGVDSEAQRMLYNGGPTTDLPQQYSWEELKYQAVVMRPFREYMLACNVVLGANRFPGRVMWCHPVEPGQVPVDWEPLESNQAGSVDLAWTAGALVDMVPLQDTLIIYSQDAIYGCEWIGVEGQGISQIFRFFNITKSRGLLNYGCAVEFNGVHYCMGSRDFYIFDGQRTESIIDGKIRKRIETLMMVDNTRRNHVSLDPLTDEVHFWFVKQGSATTAHPNYAFVYDTVSGTWSERDYALEIPQARLLLNSHQAAYEDRVYYAVDRTNERLIRIDGSNGRAGAATPWEFGRYHLTTPPGHNTLEIVEAVLHTESATNQQATIEVLEKSFLGGSVSWQTPRTHNPQTNNYSTPRANGMFIGYRVRGDATGPLQFARVDLNMTGTGKRRG